MILVASNLVFSCGLVQGFGRILIWYFYGVSGVVLVGDLWRKVG